jgi:hypothetical protein
VTVFGIHRAQFSQPILKSAGIFSEMGNEFPKAEKYPLLPNSTSNYAL